MDAYLGEIRIFAGNFAPKGWALCDGGLLPISQHTPLFSIIGTMYGGDGKTVFALPDLRGRAPMHHGTGPGLTPRMQGMPGGNATVALTEAQMPAHHHIAQAAASPTSNSPVGNVWSDTAPRIGQSVYITEPDTTLGPTALGLSGGSQPHNNMQPYVGINFIICIEGGDFPPRS